MRTVRSPKPPVRSLGLMKDRVKCAVDAENMTHAFHDRVRDIVVDSTPPYDQRAKGNGAKQRADLAVDQPPCPADPEERPHRRAPEVRWVSGSKRMLFVAVFQGFAFFSWELLALTFPQGRYILLLA